MPKPKAQSTPKPIKPIRQKLWITWIVWIICRLLVLPIIVGMPYVKVIMAGMAWQLVVLLPVLLLSGIVMRGKSPYPLIFISMLTLIYLGNAGLDMLTKIYAYAPLGVQAFFVVEFVLLLMINAWLFILLRRLPPMHQANRQLTDN
ncbi:hypothetical protein LU293_06960 [Moraxella nasovis]|uniref:hypothetical protein n=1 Tax=Moraxella nasovis TaxID=2904121 RepID=UPI001F60057F|nr:hypothetical protein [Moraxella nasovis]UNU72834.1 hypothetical protein LU293_06960 [Moraxella nasovis]